MWNNDVQKFCPPNIHQIPLRSQFWPTSNSSCGLMMWHHVTIITCRSQKHGVVPVVMLRLWGHVSLRLNWGPFWENSLTKPCTFWCELKVPIICTDWILKNTSTIPDHSLKKNWGKKNASLLQRARHGLGRQTPGGLGCVSWSLKDGLPNVGTESCLGCTGQEVIGSMVSK